MSNITRKLLIVAGTMLILSALFLCVYNFRQSNTAFEQSQEVLTELKELIPEPAVNEPNSDIYVEPDTFVNPADDLFAPYEEEEEETTVYQPAPLELDGTYYCGYITLPVLGLELPVVDGWSYDALRYSPCRYSGSAAENNMIIAAHNYNSHFGRIENLNSGDEIIFTDTDGNHYHYVVDNIQYVDGSDVDAMFSGQEDQWELTIFTCTLSGKSRVTVRAVSAE